MENVYFAVIPGGNPFASGAYGLPLSRSDDD